MRVMVCCAALGGAVGVCLAFVSERIATQYENLLIRDEMNAELDLQIAQRIKDPDALPPRSAWKSLYIDRPGQRPTSPAALRTLPPGIHELEKPEDRDQFAAIRIAPIGRVTLVAGLPSSPARDRRFVTELLAMILLGFVLGGWLGRLLADSMLEPVLRLARDVDSPEPGSVWQGIATDHRRDAVGALANALIRYRARMRAAVEREVLFSADASHELRTPLSVLQGAVDLMRETAGPAGNGRGRIDRMQRSIDEMAALLDALLLIARPTEAIDTRSGAELGPALAAVVAEFREQLDAARIAIGLRCADGARIHAPPELLRVALRLLFRSIANGACGNDLRLDADARGIVLAASDGSAATPLAPAQNGERRSDETGGVGMLRRLCRRYGWALELADDPAQPALLTLRFWAPETGAESVAIDMRS